MTHQNNVAIDTLLAIHEQRNSAYELTQDKVDTLADSDKNVRARRIDHLLSHFVLPRLEHIKAGLTQRGYASQIRVTRQMLDNTNPSAGQVSEVISQLEFSFSPLPLADNLPPPSTNDYRMLFFARPQSVFISTRYITPVATSAVQSIYFADDYPVQHNGAIETQASDTAENTHDTATAESSVSVSASSTATTAESTYCHQCPYHPQPPCYCPHPGVHAEIDDMLADFISLTLLIERAQLSA